MEFGAEFMEFTLLLSGEEAGVAPSLVFGGHGGGCLVGFAYDMFNVSRRSRGSSLLSFVFVESDERSRGEKKVRQKR